MTGSTAIMRKKSAVHFFAINEIILEDVSYNREPIRMKEEISTDDKPDIKAEKKRQRKLEQALETGSIDTWDRYRMLTDLLEQYTDIVEMADRKTRFALVILGALNAVNLLVVARPDVLVGVFELPAAGLGVYVTAYVGLSLYLFVQAIGALRPRMTGVVQNAEKAGPEGYQVLGLRFMQNILDCSFDEYYAKWQTAQMGHVNRETAMTVRVLARIITEKYRAIERLYAGLLVLVFLTAGFITTLIYTRWS